MDWQTLLSGPTREALALTFLVLLSHAIPWLDALDIGFRIYVLRARGDAPFQGHAADEDARGVFPAPYAIAVSVHNVEGDLAGFLAGLGPHRERLWIVDDASTDRTSRYLERENVPVVRVPTNLKKPSALRRLVAELPDEIGTVVVLDPDVVLDPEVASLVGLDEFVLRFQRSGCGAACPRITAEGAGLLGELQALEYDVSMLVGRRSLGDVCTTSGAAIYRRDALVKALDAHSRSVYAEDLENALLLLTSGERIYYDGDLVLRARCPETWTVWFSQRVGWSYGLIRAYLLYWWKIWGARAGTVFVYQYIIYLGVLSILLHPFRIVCLLLFSMSVLNAVDALLGLNVIPDTAWTSPYLFSLAYVQYTILIVATVLVTSSPGRRRKHLRVAPVFFLYALANVVPTTIGFVNWLSLRYGGRRLYRDHYTDASADVLVAGTAATR